MKIKCDWCEFYEIIEYPNLQCKEKKTLICRYKNNLKKFKKKKLQKQGIGKKMLKV